MTKDNISMPELFAQLTTHDRVTYCLMLRRAESNWILQAMMTDTHAKRKAQFVYDYGHVAFLGGTKTGAQVASWLRNLKGRVSNFKFTIPKLQDNIFSDRWPSHTRQDLFLRLPHPFSIHHLHIMGRADYQQDFNPLVKSGCPSFPTLSDAAHRFLYGLQYQPGNRQPDDIIIRFARTEAWLDMVRLDPTAISVTVLGTNVSGTRLELSVGSDLRFDKTLRRPGTRKFSIIGGLPDRVWIVLSRGDTWLDYRDVNLRGGSSSDGAVSLPAPDICTQIKGLIERGESDTREFKQEISREKSSTFLKTVAGFANGSGGVILFGVVDETGEVKGIRGDLQQQKDRITNMIRDTVVPQPEVKIAHCTLNGKRIIAAFVTEGDSPPYGLDAAKPRFYVRRGATTFPANQSEIRALAKKNDPDYGSGLIYPLGSEL